MSFRRLSALAVMAAVLLAGASAYADNRLLPTDMLEPGRFYTEMIYSYNTLTAKLVQDPNEVDVDGEEHTIDLTLAFGVSNGVDVVIRTPYLATGESRWEMDTFLGWAKFRSYSEGFNDTNLSIRFKAADKRSGGADLVLSAICVLPSGYRKDGEAGVEVAGYDIRPKRDFPGEGVVSYGAGLAVSGESGYLEPYLTAAYVFGGRRTRHDIKEHYADEASLGVGIQAHSSPHATFDFRILAIYNGPQTNESGGDRVRSSNFMLGMASMGMYFEFAPNATFIIGISYIMMETHQADRDADLVLKGATGMRPSIGFHILF
jgi:hypothetical protein